MPRKYLKKTLEVRAGATKIYGYNENGDLVRTHDRSYTPKSWVVIPSDMPREYSDYGYWNKPYFLAKAERVGLETKILIQRVIEKFDYPVQFFRSCFGILSFAEKYGEFALEACCHDAILRGKCNYTYIANTTSMYAVPVAEPPVDRLSSTLKPLDKNTVVTGAWVAPLRCPVFRYSQKQFHDSITARICQAAYCPPFMTLTGRELRLCWPGIMAVCTL